jgi:hypothetical protein
MKKLIYVAAFLLAVVTGKANASTADLFQINDDMVVAEMSDLTSLENYVNDHAGVTLTEVVNNASGIAASLNLKPTAFEGLSSMLRGGDLPLGIPAFWWGCVLGFVGIAVVYFTTEDRDETKKALWGCMIPTAIGILYYVFVIVLFASTAASSTI